MLARVGDDLELVREVAADGAGVSGHGPVLQAEAVEDPLVSLEHGLVAARGTFLVTVEGVGVLHRELAPAHHAEARAALVAKLGLDVIEILR